MSSRYRITDRTEHSCCYDCAIEDTTKPTMIGGKHYNGEYYMVCECSTREDAEIIVAALNCSDGQLAGKEK